MWIQAFKEFFTFIIMTNHSIDLTNVTVYVTILVAKDNITKLWQWNATNFLVEELQIGFQDKVILHSKGSFYTTFLKNYETKTSRPPHVLTHVAGGCKCMLSVRYFHDRG